MRVLDDGHVYALQSLDGGGHEILSFVKRVGPGYPGNVGAHPGTTTQEVCRAEINRMRYVNAQQPDYRNAEAIYYFRKIIELHERRAADRHGRRLVLTQAEFDNIENLPVCKDCGHIGCKADGCGKLHKEK